MVINGYLDINNMPEVDGQGYEVVTNDEGVLWHYGFYLDIADAQKAVSEHTERFMVAIG